MSQANAIVNKMHKNDPFSKWLGISILDVKKGACTLQLEIKQEMLNGFSIAHGGIAYSIADSALAFAANTYGKMAVSIETSISHTKQVTTGDTITAVCTELNRSNKIGVYQVEITNQNKEIIALFKGTVYVTGKNWEI